MKSQRNTSLEQWAFRLLCASAFGSAFSLPLGRSFLLLSLILLITRALRGGGRIVFPFSAWCWVAFATIASLSSAFGVNPALSFSKIDKLIWFMGIPVAATLATSRVRILILLRAYIHGTLVLALKILVLRVFEAWQACQTITESGGKPDLWWEIIDRGSMTHGQALSVALAALAGLMIIAARHNENGHHHHAGQALPIAQCQPIRRVSAWLMTILTTAALLLNFKRGSWVAAAFVTAAFLGLTGRWRRLAMLAAAALAMTALPPVQHRLGALRDEMTLGHGGRLVMWTKIAPTLIREHPFGIGYRALDEKLMQDTARRLGVRVEENRNHLHSNVLHITASIGWAGLAVYLLWMGRGLYCGLRPLRQNTVAARLADEHDCEPLLPLTLAMMLLALFINGLVEYNFGDGELVLVYGLLFGMLERQQARSIPSAALQPPCANLTGFSSRAN
jgi:hypothetical protein